MVVLFGLAYAVLRYHVAGPLPRGWLNARKALGVTGFLLVLIQALMSFLLFTPTVYAKFLEADGTLTPLAGVNMLGGVKKKGVCSALFLVGPGMTG